MVNSVVLASILKQIYQPFDLASFENRLKLQKIIYLLQASGINLGFQFSLYINGPYSPDLTRTAYCVESFNDTPPVNFEDEQMVQKFEMFCMNVNDHKNDTQWLEAAATIHLFSKMHQDQNPDEILRLVNAQKPHLTVEYLKQVMEGLSKWLMIN